MAGGETPGELGEPLNEGASELGGVMEPSDGGDIMAELEMRAGGEPWRCNVMFIIQYRAKRAYILDMN